VLEWTSALPDLIQNPGRTGADGQRSLRLTEIRGWSLTQVGVFAGRNDPAAAVINAQAQGDDRVYRIAADQYWVVSRDASLPVKLAAAVSPDIGTVTPLTHARVRLSISGPAARKALEKLLPIDLRPDKFRVGEFHQTGMHHVGIFVERVSTDSFQLFLLRTFALTLWEVLQDAALEFGYEVSIEPA
jgi:heterotetrameric sarcosine oxidase gamma subunit